MHQPLTNPLQFFSLLLLSCCPQNPKKVQFIRKSHSAAKRLHSKINLFIRTEEFFFLPKNINFGHTEAATCTQTLFFYCIAYYEKSPKHCYFSKVSPELQFGIPSNYLPICMLL